MSVEERVAIVGAGPVGLLSALGLAQAGIPVIVIERASEIIASPRAITYHWSVLEGLDRLGLLEEALDVGFAKQDYTYLDFATGEKINYSFRRPTKPDYSHKESIVKDTIPNGFRLIERPGASVRRSAPFTSTEKLRHWDFVSRRITSISSILVTVER
jgi:FAD binding domain